MPEPIMLPRRHESQLLETAAAWRFCETEMLAASRPAERALLSLLPPDVVMLSFRGRRAPIGAALPTGSRRVSADVRFAQNVKIVPNSLRHECARVAGRPRNVLLPIVAARVLM